MNKSVPTTKKVIVALIFANILEWYGFTIFVEFSILHFYLFFPKKDATGAGIAHGILFAAAFILRPVGGLIYAHYGDKYGRLSTLTAAIIFMLIPTFLIGLIPPVALVGLLAPTIIIIFRLLQGLSAGGEFPGSFTYAVEYANDENRGFVSSMVFSGAMIGTLIALFTSTVTNYLLAITQIQWLWRIPFLLSLPFAALGIYYLRNLAESQLFLKLKLAENTSHAPLAEVLRDYYQQIINAILIAAIFAIVIYQLFIMMPSYNTVMFSMPNAQAATLAHLSLTTLIIFIPIMGFISDKIGRKPVMICGMLGLLVDAYPLYLLFSYNHYALTFLTQILLGILTACVVGPLPALLAEMFPTRIRYTAVSLAYNISSVIFGSLAPFAVIYMVHLTKNDKSPSLIVIIIALLSLLSLLSIKETYRRKLTPESITIEQ